MEQPEIDWKAGRDEMDEGGMPVHVPMRFNRKGMGPIDDDASGKWGCWCPLTTDCQVVKQGWDSTLKEWRD